MQIRKMCATFGKLKGETLRLRPGLNCIYAPNESGKSTWSHFLRVMLYGINTRDRGAMADKNRFFPWSGQAMSGTMDLLTDEGDAITLRRSTLRQNAPMGDFSCTYTDTATPVTGIFGSSAGETLLGIGQEVFLRSAFIRHSALVVDKDVELERRIAALITAGEEDISFSEVYGRLKKELNRRRHNKTGLLPSLEAEISALQTQLDHMDDLQQQCSEARRLLQQYEDERRYLDGQLKLWQRRTLQEAGRKHAAAEEAAAQAATQHALLQELYPHIPEESVLSALEGRFAALQNTLTRATQALESVQQSRRDAEDARHRWESAALFPADEETLRQQLAALSAPKMPSFLWWVLPLAAALCCGAAVFNYLHHAATPLFGAAIGAGVLALGSAIALLWRSYAVRALQTACDEKKRALQQDIDAYLPLWNAYSDKQATLSRCEIAAEERKQHFLSELTSFLSALHPFIAAEDMGSAQAALRTLRRQHRHLQQAKEAQRSAEMQRDILAQALPEGAAELAAAAPITPDIPREEVAQRQQHAASMEQSARSRLDTLTGQLRSMGNSDDLRFRLQEMKDRRTVLQEEYDALSLSMSVLDEANTALQNRFSPALGAAAAEIFHRLSAGRYEKVLLSRDFSLEAETGDDSIARSVLLLSQGAADQLYLSVRLAICDTVLPEGKSTPLVLDDALLSFDDDRLHAALDFLLEESRHRQILLFTCQKREQEYLAGRENVTLLTL